MLISNKTLLKRFLPLSALMLVFSFSISLVKAQSPLGATSGFGGINVDENSSISWSTGNNEESLEVLRLTNIERQKYGLPPLQHSTILSIAAACHAKDLAEHNDYYIKPENRDFNHIGSDGSKEIDRIMRAGYQPMSYGENIYQQYPNITAAEAVNWWMSSPNHRANILSPYYTEIGLGYSLVSNGSIHRFVQVFGSPQPGSTLTENMYCQQ